MSFANVYHLRRVAEASAKPCEICYKPTTAVLITADNRTDFFYACTNHLKDKGFASPIVDEREAASKKKREELDAEVERVKKEFEEKQKKKKEKEKEKEKKKDSKKDADDSDSSKKKGKGKEQEKEKDKDKFKSDTTEESTTAAEEEEIPRIYALHRTLYQSRLSRARNAELARRNRERLKNPSTFPRVPSGDL